MTFSKDQIKYLDKMIDSFQKDIERKQELIQNYLNDSIEDESYTKTAARSISEYGEEMKAARQILEAIRNMRPKYDKSDPNASLYYKSGIKKAIDKLADIEVQRYRRQLAMLINELI